MYYDISSARLSLLTPSHPLAGTMMPRSKTRCTIDDYSPNDVEGAFYELRHNGVLRSSDAGSCIDCLSELQE
jgi:hypothetical protein